MNCLSYEIMLEHNVSLIGIFGAVNILAKAKNIFVYNIQYIAFKMSFVLYF